MSVTELFKIKPLEWRQTYEDREWRARVTGGSYRVYCVVEHWYWEEPDYWNVHCPDGGNCESFEAGKIAAESHWRERLKQVLIAVEDE